MCSCAQIREAPLYHIVNAKVLMAQNKLEEARKVRIDEKRVSCFLYPELWSARPRYSAESPTKEKAPLQLAHQDAATLPLVVSCVLPCSRGLTGPGDRDESARCAHAPGPSAACAHGQARHGAHPA